MKKTIVNVSAPVAVAAAPSATAPARRSNPAMSQLSAQYRSLPAHAKALWNLVYIQMQALKMQGLVPEQTAVAIPGIGGNGWTAYYACNAVLLSTQQPLVSVPGQALLPANLPLLDATIARTGPGTPVSIMLIPKAQNPYPAGASIAVWASPAAPLGNAIASAAKYRAKQYVFLQTYDGGIPVSGLNVTEAYLGVFAAIPDSCRFAFKVMAVTSDGFHSELQYTCGDTPMLSLAQAVPVDDDLHLAK